MVLPIASASPILRPRVAPVVGPRFGLLDVLAHPQLMPIAEKSSRNSRKSSGNTGVSPLRWHAGQVGLLDAFDNTGPLSGGATRDDQGTLQFIGRYPVRSNGPKRSDDNTVLLDAGKKIWDGIAQAGKDTWTGYLIGASGMYDTAGDAFGLLNRANDFMVDLTGLGQMSEGTIWKDAENFLHKTALEVAPRPEDLPTSFIGNMYAGIGRAPAEVAQLLTAARLAGPIAGIAGLEGVRESENGWEAATSAAAKGALFGLAAKALDPLNWLARSSGLTTLGVASGVAEGDDPADAISSAVPLGLLGAFGVPRARQPNLQPLQVALSDFDEAAKHAGNSLDIIRGLPPKRQQQLRIQINQRPGLRLEDVVRKSDELLNNEVGRGGRYKLPTDPRLLDERIYDSSRSKWWWTKPQEVEVKREKAQGSRAQRLADKVLEEQGVSIVRRRENEILKRARVQLGKEGRFDAEAMRLAEIIRQRSRGRGRLK